VKIIIHGPLAGPGWDGSPALQSWGPDELVEVDDRNARAVAWARGWLDTPYAELVEDAKEAKETRAPAGAAKTAGRP
jgi:hypothetical protein